MNRYLRGAALLACAGMIALLFSCAGVPKNIPEDLSARQLIQFAQEANDASNYAAAKAYYTALKDRYGDNPALLVNAEYELAFIDYKQHKYSVAEAEFAAILDRYKGENASAYPEAFKILSQKLLDEIQSKKAKSTQQ